MRKPILIIIFAFSVLFFLVSTSYAEIPRLINYQGKLTDISGNPVSDGTHSITFRIYDADSGGNLLWEETQNLLIQKGIFSCLLGGVTNLNIPFDKPYWLAIKVGSDAEMTPRQQIASAGYAYMAEDVISVPRGVIVIWSGQIQDIPQGWALCDGNNGTPNLTDRFVIHADADSGGTNDVGDAGGSSSLVGGDLSFSGTAGVTGNYNQVSTAHGGGENQYIRSGHPHDHNFTPAGTISGTPSIRDKYYALAYIMKVIK